MSENKRIGCILLAAGTSSRYAGDKLAVCLGGRTLGERALDAIPRDCVERTVVVSSRDYLLTMAAERGFLPVENTRPAEGISRSIRLSLAALGDGVDGALFLTADQPLLRAESVRTLCRLWQKDPTRLVSAAANGRRGSPCLFPKSLFPELAALEGDMGGRAVIAAHAELLCTVELPGAELMDMDTPEDFSALPFQGGTI